MQPRGENLLEQLEDRFPFPIGCRWFMMQAVEDLPGIQQCGDCGIYIRDDGSYIAPEAVEIMRVMLNETYCDDSYVAITKE